MSSGWTSAVSTSNGHDSAMSTNDASTQDGSASSPDGAPAFDSPPRAGLARIRALSPEDRETVELISVFGSTPRTDLARALGKMGRRSGSRAVRYDEIAPALTALVEQGTLREDGHFEVAPDLRHAATSSATEGQRLSAMARVVREVRPIRGTPSREELVRELRIELYGGHFEEAMTLSARLGGAVFAGICRPFDDAWVGGFPRALLGKVLMGVLDAGARELLPTNRALQMLEALPQAELSDGEHHLLFEQLLLRGRFDEAARALAGRDSIQAKLGTAWLGLLRGQTEKAIAEYESALTAYLKHAGKRAGFFPDRAGFFFLVALLARGTGKDMARADMLAIAAQKAKSDMSRACQVISEMVEALGEQREPERTLFIGSDLDLERIDPVELLVSGLCSAWIGKPASPELAEKLFDQAERAKAAGYHWLARELADVLHRIGTPASSRKLTQLRAGAGPTLFELRRQPERWHEVLDALSALASPQKARPVEVEASPSHDLRLLWIATFNSHLDLRPIEQARSKGSWSKGRPVALKRLYEDAAGMAWLTPADREAIRAIKEHVTFEYGRYRRVNYYLDDPRALLALAGQPNVFVEQNGTLETAQIRRGTPRLRVSEISGAHHVTLEPAPKSLEDDVHVTHPGPGILEVISFAPVHHAIAKILGPKGLSAPKAATGKLREVLGALSLLVTVEADIAAAPTPARTGRADGPGSAGTATAADPPETVAADARPVFVLRAVGEGLGVEIVVKPFGSEGPSARAGEGGASLFARISGRAVLGTRDLERESERARRALAACPTLAAAQTGSLSFSLPVRDTALEALSEIQALAAGSEEVALEWADGETLALRGACGVESLHLDIRAKGEGFDLTGRLDVPDFGPLAIGTLLDYLAASPGRFLRLEGDGRFLALTRDLRQRLDELSALRSYPQSGRGKRLSFHPLAASLVDQIVSGAHLSADAAYRSAVDRLTAGGEDTVVPSTFRAELRPYQLDGYRWLSRLASFGLGGCLADEMGLGKTVQALALLVSRAPAGPSLVVAPTSVVSQWTDELARFAPTLRPRSFTGEGRENALVDLQPFDVVLTSYAILQLEADRLATETFEVAILDEAQAIKNAETQRAQAAFRLSARARFATTGTPIENRLGELHSLFRFLNPGFLGSEKAFEERFVRPIERDRSAAASDGLRRLVAPFVLRRSKSQVLPELPSRTEVTLRVTLGDQELALYEVLRDEALKGLVTKQGIGPKQRFQLLAIITRLRRAASNARMVLPDSKAESAKLEALEELMDELLQGGHKALVFSQFVDHLGLIRELLDRRGVSYQYLDGGTSAAKRKQAVQAFQAGRSDVFLISLKAGGLGLNLTAADSVIHMDPWWNPASEDQASDRAHRIGQVRPVTIYRIIAKQTIEEKILDLHHRKRELARSLLEDAESAGKLSEAELLELIRAGAEGGGG